jgi:hypothetical protein
VLVEVTPIRDLDGERDGKSSLRIRIWKGGEIVWSPTAPLRLSPLYDPDSAKGRSEAANAAVDFFEFHHCGAGFVPNPKDDDRLGTVIAGTMRIEDLIPAFLDELERIDPFEAASLAEEFADLLARVADAPDTATRASVFASDDAAALLEALFDALDERAPDGAYFGAHPGDGADFGFWPVQND